MAPYRYAANRAALLDGVAEVVMGALVIEPRAPAWRQELRASGVATGPVLDVRSDRGYRRTHAKGVRRDRVLEHRVQQGEADQCDSGSHQGRQSWRAYR
jgi:hypothetical protein